MVRDEIETQLRDKRDTLERQRDTVARYKDSLAKGVADVGVVVRNRHRDTFDVDRDTVEIYTDTLAGVANNAVWFVTK